MSAGAGDSVRLSVTRDPRVRDARAVDQPVAGGAAFVLCRCSAGLNRHGAQWALPGGRLDPGESPIEAALREIDDEVGERFEESAVLGLLGDAT